MRLEKIFRYEIYKINNYLLIDSPLLNLLNPTFNLDNKILYIYLEKSSSVYYIDDLNDIIIDSINKKNCYIREIINNGKIRSHQIIT